MPWPARSGAEPAEGSNRLTPSPSDADGNVTVTVVDAYDSSYLLGTGTYCVLGQLPATLTSSVCTGNSPIALNGPLSRRFSVSPPPMTNGIASFYIAVVRNIGGAHTNTTTPVVGASILVDSATLTLPPSTGDKFVGDDVVFGFMTSQTGASGFPWMQEP